MRRCEAILVYNRTRCEADGTVPTANGGAALGVYCMRHFRDLYPDIAPSKDRSLKPAPLRDRQIEALRLREEEHLAFREIGQRLGGVSSPRAREIVLVAERQRHRIAAWVDPAHCPNWVGEGVPA